jgi:hypothetical protein
MIGRTTTARYWGCSATIATVLGLTTFVDANSAWAQAEAAPPPPAAAPPAAPVTTPSTGVTNPPPPAALPPPPPATPSAIEAAPKPPTAAEAMPASRPDVLPPIDVGAWLRAGSIFQGQNTSKINDWHMDSAYVELHAGGKIHKNVSVTLNLNSNMLSLFNPPGSDPMTEGGAFVQVEDAIISFDFMDEFHLWGGHLLVPVDRANSAGPFFMIPWNYPGFFSAQGNLIVSAPAEGPSGRNNGAVVWGDIAGGKFSYFAGAFDNANVATSPLFSGKLRLALLDPEPGFWGNASYFGDKDILSIDVGGQFQKHGSTTAMGDKDYSEFNVDALFEKKLGGGSFVTAEGALYLDGVNDGGVSTSLYVLAAYASPTVGVGNIQPMVRYQWAKIKNNMDTNPWNLDAAVTYLIKGPALRAVATYSYTKLPGGLTANGIQLGAQAIFF